MFLDGMEICGGGGIAIGSNCLHTSSSVAVYHIYRATHACCMCTLSNFFFCIRIAQVIYLCYIGIQYFLELWERKNS